MRRIAQLTTAAALLFTMTTTGMAQEEAGTQERPPLLGPPVFSLMLGGLFTNVVSAPEGVDEGAGFMTRFQTTIPTASRFVVLVAGLQWAPNGVDGNKQNSPGFFGGPVVLTPPEWTSGWLVVGLDALALFGAGGGDRTVDDPDDEVNPRPYGWDLYGEFVVVVPFGAKMFPQMAGPLAGTSLVGLVSQKITNLGEDPDRFNPGLLGYLSIPIAPWGL